MLIISAVYSSQKNYWIFFNLVKTILHYNWLLYFKMPDV